MKLRGKHVLVVEDNWLVADQLSSLITCAGGTVCGPSPEIDQAFRLASRQRLHGAVLDVQLKDGTAQPVATVLRRRHVPFLVISGMDRTELPDGLRKAPFLAKPLDGLEFLDLAGEAFARSADTPGGKIADARLPRVGLAQRLCAELVALTGSGDGAVNLDLLPRRLSATWAEVDRAAHAARERGWLVQRGRSVSLTELGRQLVRTQ